jgi:exonuclease VII large subunit
MEHRLHTLDPVATLRRGYAVVQRSADNQVVTSTSQVREGDGLAVTVADGVISATTGPATKARVTRKKQKSAASSLPGMERLL